MAEAVVSFVVERIGDLLTQEAKFLEGVRGQVDQMQVELKHMQSFLKDADKRQGEDARLKGWISEIREVAYDAEDVIENFALEVPSRSQAGFKNKCKWLATIFNKGAKLHKVGTEIETIKTRIAALTESLRTYGIKFEESEASSSSVFKRQQNMRRTYSHLVEGYTVGLERHTEILVSQLVTEEEQSQVIFICGMGGLGKTTLAKKAYHHNKVRCHFDSFAWAYISQQFKTREVWEGILIKFVAPSKERRKEISKMRDEEIAMELYQVQQEKKCLVILDDIWRGEAWDVLKTAFPIGNTTSSKIVLTTRNKTLALNVNPRRILEPQCLTEEESWELLQKKVFFAKDYPKDYPDFKVNREMEEIGRKMVRRCAGLPLAINVLGGILAQKHFFDEWKKVHENIIFYLRRGNEGYEEEVSGIQSILGLSYHELSHQLKPCFLYVAHFPKDYEIPTKELFRMWVAEGFVQQQSNEEEENQTKEDIAELYLQELINRCMLQVGLIGPSGAVKTCRIHDLMRDLCLLKANEENFLESVHGYNQLISPSVHRLAMHGVRSCNPTYYSRAPKLRTLLFFTKDGGSGWPSFKLLRMLTIDELNQKPQTMEKEIGNLVHLRYLVIKSCWIHSLPSSIGNLRFLQTLIVKSEFIIRIPNVIWKLEWLRHLNLGNIQSTTRDGKMQLGNLRYLQTLKTFDAHFFDVGELVNFTKLRNLSLVLQDMEELKVLKPSGLIFNHLTSLRIVVKEKIKIPYLVLLISSCCPNLYKLRLEGEITKLPEHHQFPPNLTKLTLVGSRLEEDPMTTLEKLPKLEYLCFKRSALQCNKIVCSLKGSPRLKTLILDEQSVRPGLKEWQVEKEAMPNLCQLHIIGCSELKMLPKGLRSITTLRELVIKLMPPEFNKRLQAVNEGGEEGEDHYKVRHVPSIVFLN